MEQPVVVVSGESAVAAVVVQDARHEIDRRIVEKVQFCIASGNVVIIPAGQDAHIVIVAIASIDCKKDNIGKVRRRVVVAHGDVGFNLCGCQFDSTAAALLGRAFNLALRLDSLIVVDNARRSRRDNLLMLLLRFQLLYRRGRRFWRILLTGDLGATARGVHGVVDARFSDRASHSHRLYLWWYMLVGMVDTTKVILVVEKTSRSAHRVHSVVVVGAGGKYVCCCVNNLRGAHRLGTLH